MSILDKIEVIKQVLNVILKIADVLVSVITTVLEKLGGDN